MRSLGLIYEIQCLDKRKRELEQEKAALPVGEEVETQRKRVRELQELLESKRARLEDLDKAIRKGEIECQDLDYKRKEIEDTLYGGRVRNPKELNSLGQKLNSIKHKKDQIEEIMLENIIARDELLESISSIETQLHKESSKLEELEKEINERLEEIEGELEKIPEERSSLEERADQKLLSRYERLTDRLGGTVIAVVEDGTCSYCRVGLSPAVTEKLKNEEVVTCENCGRILYSKND